VIVRVVNRVVSVLQGWPQWLVMAGSLAMMAGLGVLDYVTGTQVNIAVMFIVPIVLVIWIAGTQWTAPLAVIAGATMFLANHAAGAEYATPLVPLWNFGSRFIVFMIVARVVVYLQQSAARAESLARTDALTGIGNVRSFRDAAELEIARAQRHHFPLTVVFIDVDDFKRINDRHGHETGDRTLRAIGQALVRHVRKTDVVARIGGDEFVMLLPLMPADHVETFVGLLSKRVHEHLDHICGPLTCSVGAVTFETPPASVDEMLRLADERMYVAKASGSNTVRHSVVTRSPDYLYAEPLARSAVGA